MVNTLTKRWKGYYVYAVDGVKVALPIDIKKLLLKVFGGVGRNAASPTAQASAIYDVLNKIIIDAAIKPLKTDERTLALHHIDALIDLVKHKMKLIIFDRGYPSFELINYLTDRNLNYVMRVKKAFNKDIDAQKDDDGIVWLEQNGEKIKARVVKVLLKSGIVETLITNIFDDEITPADFKVLYSYRWPIETAYNFLKNNLEIGRAHV